MNKKTATVLQTCVVIKMIIKDTINILYNNDNDNNSDNTNNFKIF